MADCECIGGCPFFHDKMADMPATADMYKNQYCKDGFEKCARYMIFKAKGKSSVPADLFPNQQERAKGIIEIR